MNMLKDETAFTIVTNSRDTDCKTARWIDIKGEITSGKYAEIISRIRAEPDKNKRRDLKARTLPAALFAGVFVERNDEGLRVQSGLVIVDIDGVDDLPALKRKLKKDPCVSAFFVSPSGDGLKALLPIGNRRYKEGWFDAEFYFNKHYKIQIDSSGKNESRLCYFSHDDELFENKHALELPIREVPIVHDYTPKAKKEYSDKRNGEKLSEKEVADLLSHIPSSPEYPEWLKVASAVWHELGEAGTPLLREWSPEREDGEYDRKFRQRLKDIGTGTLVYLAKQNGYVSPKKENSKPVKREINNTDTQSQEIPKVYYDGVKYYYPRRNQVGWVKMDMPSVRRQMKVHFCDSEGKEDKEAITQQINDLQLDNYVDYCGSIAGYPIGEIHEDSKVWLVTAETILMEAKEGDCHDIMHFFITLLGEEQFDVFIAWLALSWKNFVNFRNGALFRPAPALAFCGQKECGKSLAMDILGYIFQRRVSGYLWLSGKSDFNGELIASEMIAIDDEAGVTDQKLRRQAANKIKSALFSGKVSIHPKGKDAITCRPWWRIVFAVNDEPESLQVLPLLDDSMKDKIILFECEKAEIPFPEIGRDGRWNKIKEQIPAFLHHLNNEAEKRDVANERSGIKEYWNQNILEKLGELSPEQKLLDLIDEILGNELPGIYAVAEIERKLKASDEWHYEAKRVLPYPNSCGKYLSRLASMGNSRVSLHSNVGHKKHYFIAQSPEK